MPRLTRIFGASYAIYGALLAVFSRPGFPGGWNTGSFWPFLADKPVSEDTFLMLTVAWNLGGGLGMTYNDGDWVTGVQPLVTLAYGSIAALVRLAGADQWDFVRIVLLAGVALHLYFAHLVGTISARCSAATRAYDTAVVLTLCSFFTFRLFASGMETGLYLILLAHLLRWMLTAPFESGRDFVVLGVLCGTVGLCRIDAGILCAVLGLWLWLGRQLPPGSLLLAAGIAALIVAPWFLWVHAVSGHWMPSSGYVQQSLIHAGDAAIRTWAMLFALYQAIFGWVDASMHVIPWFFVLPTVACGGLVLSGMVWWLLRQRRAGRADPEIAALSPLLAMALAALVLSGVYFVQFHALHFYSRYVSPLMVATLPIVSIFLAEFFSRSLDRPAVRAMAAVVLATVFLAQAYRWHHRGLLHFDFPLTAGYIGRHFPDVPVGVFQSGVVGYFNRNVVNLDGKVNLELVGRAGTVPLPEYLDRKGIQVIVDWKWIIESAIPEEYLRARWASCSDPMPLPSTICLKRKP